MVAGLGPGREGVLAQPGDRDDVPLQALGRVHGEDLHGAVDHLDLARGEPALLLLGRGQVGQERRERAALGLLGEPGRHVTDRVEVGPGQPGPGRGAAVDGDLDVEPDRLGDVGDQVGQALVEPDRRPRSSSRNRRSRR